MYSYVEIMMQNIKLTMEKKCIRQKDLIDNLHFSQSNVSHWFTGVCSMNLDAFIQICDYLHVTPNQMLGIDPLDRVDILPDEKAILDIRSKLNPFGKITFDAMAQLFASNPSMSSESEKLPSQLSFQRKDF